MKFCRVLIVSVLICFIFSFRSFAQDNNNREILLSEGFPEYIVNSASDSSVDRILSLFRGDEISDVSTEIEYYPKNIAENANLVVYIISAQMRDKHNGKYTGETVCAYWEWLDNKPKIREKDYLTLKWSDDKFNYESDSFYAEDYSRKNVQGNWTVRNTYNTLAESKQNRVGHWTDLYEKENCVGGVMILRLIPESFELTDSQIFLNCEYIHYITTLPTIALYVFAFAFLFACIFFIIVKKKSLNNTE